MANGPELTEGERIAAQARRALKAGKGIVHCPYRQGSKRFLWRQAYREALAANALQSGAKGEE